jgi:hypothetical protein
MTTTDLVLRPTDDLDTPSTTNPATTPTWSARLIARADALLSGGFAQALMVMAEALGLVEQAEEEIQAARIRHPRHADRIYHAFPLLVPSPALERLESEMVYRSHCRELLDRVAAGTDTRPGTAAEVCCVMLHTSLLSPLTSAATGLYMRMWQTAGFPELPEFTEARHHHEALESTVIDDHEQFARRKLAVADRRLGAIDCPGRHHGDEVDCAYRPIGQLAIDI